MSRHLAETHRGRRCRRRHDAERQLQHAADRRRAALCAAFAAGSGITPVLSIAATVLEAEPASRFQLYYGNTHMARTMFLEEIQALKNRYLARFSVFS